MKKLTKSQVIAKLKKEGSATVQLFPSKCGPANTMWVQGYEVELDQSFLNSEYPNNEELKHVSKFDSLINHFSYYNCNSDLGKRVHFYIKE